MDIIALNIAAVTTWAGFIAGRRIITRRHDATSVIIYAIALAPLLNTRPDYPLAAALAPLAAAAVGIIGALIARRHRPQ